MKTLKFTFVALLTMGLGVITANAQTAQKPKATHKTAVHSKTPAKHLKKDGTPDMHYKENKKAAGKSEHHTKTIHHAAVAHHTKAAGTPKTGVSHK